MKWFGKIVHHKALRGFRMSSMHSEVKDYLLAGTYGCIANSVMPWPSPSSQQAREMVMSLLRYDLPERDNTTLPLLKINPE